MTDPGRGWAHVVGRRGDPPPDAHLLLRELVGARTGSDPDDVRVLHHCPRCGSHRHGRPRAVVRSAPLAVNVSVARTSGLVVVAASDRSGVGVDVELATDHRFVEAAPVTLHPDEQATSVRELARSWVRKEAVTKCVGLGLEVPFSQILISETSRGPALTSWPSTAGPAPEFWIRDIDAEPYVWAVAFRGSVEPDLTVDWW